MPRTQQGTVKIAFINFSLHTIERERERETMKSEMKRKKIRKINFSISIHTQCSGWIDWWFFYAGCCWCIFFVRVSLLSRFYNSIMIEWNGLWWKITLVLSNCSSKIYFSLFKLRVFSKNRKMLIKSMKKKIKLKFKKKLYFTEALLLRVLRIRTYNLSSAHLILHFHLVLNKNFFDISLIFAK